MWDKKWTRELTPSIAIEPTPEILTKAKKSKTKRKISSFKLHEEFLYEFKNEEKNINDQITVKKFLKMRIQKRVELNDFNPWQKKIDFNEQHKSKGHPWT